MSPGPLATPGRLVLALTALAVLALPLSGCGKRPGSVLAPEGADPDAYPRVYPPPAP